MTNKIVSILLVFVFVFSLSVVAFAASGDSSGTFDDFVCFSFFNTTQELYSVPNTSNILTSSTSTCDVYWILPYSLSSDGHFSILQSSLVSFQGTPNSFLLAFFNSSGGLLSQVNFRFPSSNLVIPANTAIVRISVGFSTSNNLVELDPSNITYSDFSYDYSSGSTDVSSVLNILNSWQTGPYEWFTSGVWDLTDGSWAVDPDSDSLDYNSLLQHVSRAMSGMTIFDIQMWSNTQYDSSTGQTRSGFSFSNMDGSSSPSSVVSTTLSDYVNQLGGALSTAVNDLIQGQAVLLRYEVDTNSRLSSLQSSVSDVSDALYTDKAENQPWSVAQWLKDIYTSITSFFSSFWSPAETDLKTAAEDGMQAAADNGNAASGSQVDDVNSAADAFKEFGSTGNIGSGDVMDIFSDGASYDFFSQTTKDNLAYHPPAGGQRSLLRSSSPAPTDQSDEEYVDELDDKLSYWREVLGLP